MRDGLQRKIDYSMGLLRKAEKLALRLDPEDGYYLAFSGGKDSQCLYHLAVMAGVKFKAHFSPTTVDPPEVVRFIRENYPDVGFEKPRASMYEMARRKRILPTMRLRWCCAEFKEAHGAGKVTLTGIRRAESARRARRNEAELPGHKFSGTFDQFSEHGERMVACAGGRDKIIISPLLEWGDRDVWEFLNGNGIPHCRLYDEGRRRIGCILCPMSSRKAKAADIRRWPHVRRNWLKTIRWLVDNGWGHNFPDAETGFRWWTSGKPFREFYADEFLQGKLDFGKEEP